MLVLIIPYVNDIVGRILKNHANPLPTLDKGWISLKIDIKIAISPENNPLKKNTIAKALLGWSMKKDIK